MDTKKNLLMLLVIALVCAVGAITVYLQTPSIQNEYQIMKIGTASMEPTLMQGSIVTVDPNVNITDLKTDYPNSDIIAFHHPNNPDVTVLHRIVATEEINGTTCYYTKGDANGAQYPATPNPTEYDNWVVSPDLIIGKVATDTDNSQAVTLTLLFRVFLIVSVTAALTSLGVYAYAKWKKK